MSAGTAVLVNATGVRSGAENVLVAVAGELADSGHEVVLLSPPGPVVDGMPPGTRHLRIPTLGLEGKGGVARLVAVARLIVRWVRAGLILRTVTGDRGDGEGGVVVVNSLFALPALPFAFPRARASGTTSWLVHDTVVSRRQRVAVSLGARRVHRAVAVSEVTAASIRPLVPRVIVRPNGVVIPRGKVVGASDREPVVGILAALTSWKGQDVLLDAVARCQGMTVEIAGGALFGEDDYERALRDRADQEDLRGRVRFLGHVDRRQVLDRWAIAVSASVLPEAGPLGVLECMAAGLPVVATDHGGAAEYLREGIGVLVAPGDPEGLANALSELIADPARRELMAERGRARAAQEHDIEMTLPAMAGALTGR